MIIFYELIKDMQKYGYESRYPIAVLRDNFKEANGCGAKGGINVPDRMWGMSVTGQCDIHDIEWKLALSYRDLVLANQRYRRNVEVQIDKYSANRFMAFLRMRRLHKYYDAIKLIGTPSYAEERNFELP